MVYQVQVSIQAKAMCLNIYNEQIDRESVPNSHLTEIANSHMKIDNKAKTEDS